MNQRSIGRQNGERARALSGARQLQYQVVPADQQIGLTVLRQFQKHLIVRVSTFGQGRQRRFGTASDRQHRQMRPVALQEILAAGGIQPELRIAGHAFQFCQREFVCQTNDLVMANRFGQRGQRRGFEVKQIHHDIGVEHQSGQRLYG